MDEMSPKARLIYRMKANPEQGTCCRYCGISAKGCQIVYVATDERAWCCAGCRLVGASRSHAERP